MPLEAGERLGPYEIVSRIGEGGMGEVYRARDTRLDRTVAIKISKQQFSERFQREARAIAALNHPFICTLHDVGPTYLVLEYVEGEPLDVRLQKGPIPLDRALPLAIQIAEALAAAHRKNIVHRDLKPANVILGKSGPKLLDFGLAKEAALSASASDTGLAMTITQEGTIAGTLNYMAPEQLEGRDIDARTDIFAFGAVLHEMLTGKPAFSGSSPASVISAVMTSHPPPVSTTVRTAPAALDRIVQRCLAKDPDARFQCAGDLAAALRSCTEVEPQQEVRPLRRLTPWLAALLPLALALGFFGALLVRRPQPPSRWSAVMLGGPSIAMAPRASPDGRLVAFATLVDGVSQVAVMKPESGNWTVLTHARDRGLVDTVSWSSDGSRLYYDRVQDGPRGIFSVPLFGGDERPILDAAADPEPVPDGSLLVLRINAERQTQLYRFWPDSGNIQPLAAAVVAGEIGGSVRAFPDGKEAVFYGQPLSGGEAHLYALDLAGNRVRKLAPRLGLRTVMGPRFPVAVSRDGRWVLIDVRSGNLHRITAVPRDGGDAESLLVTTTATPWFLDLAADGSLYMDQMDRPVDILRFPVSGGVPERITGSFQESMRGLVPLAGGGVLMPGPAGGREGLLVVEPGGRKSASLLDTVGETEPPVALAGPDQVALTIRTTAGREIAVASVSEHRVVRRVRVPQSSIWSLALSRDGRQAYYAADHSIWAVAFDGGQPRRVGPGDSLAMYPGGDALLVQLAEREGTRLVRVSLNDGSVQAVPMRSASGLSAEPLAPNAIASDGRIALSIISSDSWFYEPGVLDPASGKITRIPVQQTADYFIVGWGERGEIIAMAMEARCSIWRFQQQAKAAE
jgi:tRNA A-37 threonylcarbamoyl transferase component Bud32